MQNWEEGNYGSGAPKRAFEKEKPRRRCAKIAIMISTIVIVLIVVLTPVSGQYQGPVSDICKKP